MAQMTRKHFLVLPSYQVRLVGFLILVMLLGSILHGYFLYHLTAKNIQQGFYSAHNRFRSTWEILKPAIIVTNGISFLVISLAFLLITIFISHRLIGPLVKVSNHLRKLDSGKWDLPPVQLRKGDEGGILSDSLNSLQKDVQGRLHLVRELRKEVAARGTLPSEELQARLDRILAEVSLTEPNARQEKGT